MCWQEYDSIPCWEKSESTLIIGLHANLKNVGIHSCGTVLRAAMKFLELFCCTTWRESYDLIIVKTCLRMFRLTPITISAH